MSLRPETPDLIRSHPVGERRRSRRGRTGPRDHLALGASRPHIVVVSAAADIIAAADIADPMSLRVKHHFLLAEMRNFDGLELDVCKNRVTGRVRVKKRRPGPS